MDCSPFFQVSFHDHTLMGLGAIAWLNRFADHPSTIVIASRGGAGIFSMGCWAY
jgi:hypothetical protein